ncbi:carB, partial [Escherichia coli FRIK523]
EWL